MVDAINVVLTRTYFSFYEQQPKKKKAFGVDDNKKREDVVVLLLSCVQTVLCDVVIFKNENAYVTMTKFLLQRDDKKKITKKLEATKSKQ